MRIILVLLFFLSFNSFACELTTEYKKLRAEVTKEIRSSYNSCLKSTKAYFFYKAVAKCEEEERGKNIGGGCYHVVGYEVTHDESELNHCKILKPTTAQSIEYLEQVAKNKKVEKCSK
ncbi:hypothetical protein KO527_06905 [Pseudoalteromonas sp. C2R02]|uniref:hypothetical protein n=1 Tax=Pseudoalteromonas sp. C2R02 TaxID=2841565 RepID=UPI001C0A4515|nr:hypothetical protein [Pseudoalteromonas sp. C2R02]MBU2969072.1 hypothetical protein [Pseudoalteromonas sp. C2R02]